MNRLCWRLDSTGGARVTNAVVLARVVLISWAMTGDLTHPIRYIERIARYYRTLGYGEPYRFATFEDVPFAPLRKPLRESRIALVTTAAPFKPEFGDQGPGATYNSAAKFYEVYAVAIDPPPDLRISHVTYDRNHTSAEDPGTWLPLAAMKDAERERPHRLCQPPRLRHFRRTAVSAQRSRKTHPRCSS